MIEVAAYLLALGPAELLQGGSIGAQPVGDDGLGAAMALHGSSDELQRGRLVPFLGDEGLQRFALVVHGAPEIAHLAVDANVDLIQVQALLGVLAHGLDPLLADLGGEHGPEPPPPEAYRLVANVDPALVQKVFHVSERQGYFTYITTTRRINSGEMSNLRNGTGGGLGVSRGGMPNGLGQGGYYPISGRYSLG